MCKLRPLRARLLPSRQLDQVSNARDTYLGIPDDDLLHGFRKRGGLSAPGKPMGGWCSATSGVIFGQVISGLSRLGAMLEDPAASEKALRLFDQWTETTGPDGDARMGTYAWDKVVGALVDLRREAGCGEAEGFLDRTVGWAARTFDRTRTPAGPIDWDGRHPRGTLEWYTLGENLYRAFLLTGNEAYRDFADVWQYPHFWTKFADTASPTDAHSVHAYSHVNSLCSLAAAYEVTGDDALLRMLRNAVEHVMRCQCFATGGYGPWERLLPQGQLGRSLDLCCDHAEVCCGSWAAFKLGTYMLRFTGEARYADWLERVLHNLIGSALPVRSDGRTYYYADYRPSGGMRLYYDSAWPCCSGTYLQSVSAYHELIYFGNTTDDAELSVAVYVPSVLKHRVGDVEVTIQQTGDYPADDRVRLRVNAPQPVRMTLRLRVPRWCVSARATVADTRHRGEGESWLTIDRIWRDGDTVELCLPTRFELEPVDEQHPHRCAVTRGALVFAQNGRGLSPLMARDADEFRERVEPDPEGRPLWYRVKDVAQRDLPTGYFRPLFDFPEGSPYRVYHDLRTPFLY